MGAKPSRKSLQKTIQLQNEQLLQEVTLLKSQLDTALLKMEPVGGGTEAEPPKVSTDDSTGQDSDDITKAGAATSALMNSFSALLLEVDPARMVNMNHSNARSTTRPTPFRRAPYQRDQRTTRANAWPETDNSNAPLPPPWQHRDLMSNQRGPPPGNMGARCTTLGERLATMEHTTTPAATLYLRQEMSRKQKDAVRKSHVCFWCFQLGHHQHQCPQRKGQK